MAALTSTLNTTDVSLRLSDAIHAFKLSGLRASTQPETGASFGEKVEAHQILSCSCTTASDEVTEGGHQMSCLLGII